MSRKEQINEGLLGRLLHNAKLKLFFSTTFIKSWISGGENGATKFNWEKTPTTPGNINVAWNTLNELQTYYASVPKDAKSLQKAQGGIISSIFSGFWTKVFQRMMGNPTKLDALAKFNSSMATEVKNMYQTLDTFCKYVDADLKKLGIVVQDQQQQTAESDETNGTNGTDGTDGTGGTDGTNGQQKKKNGGENGGEEEDNLEAKIKKLYTAIQNLPTAADDLVKNDKTKSQDLKNKVDDFKSVIAMWPEDNFISECKTAVENNKLKEEQIEVAWKRAAKAQGDLGTLQTIVNAVAEKSNEVNLDPEELVKILGVKDAPSAVAGDAARGINGLIQAFAKINDKTDIQIVWAKGGLGKLENVYRAEDSLYKVLVFCGAWVDNLMKGIQYDDNGTKIETSTEEVMQFLKTNTGKLLQNFQASVTKVNDSFAKSSGFGTLQESEMKEIKEGLEKLNEKDFNMRQKHMKRTNEALARLKMCMEMEEPVDETAPQDLAPEEPVTTEETKEEADAMSSRLRKLADARKVREERAKKGKMKVIFGNESKESANEAISRLARFAEETEVKVQQPETQVVKEPNAEPKKEHLGIEVVFGEEVPSDRALKQLQNLVYDGEPPAVDVPVDEGAAPAPAQPQQKPEDEQDEVIEVVTEAPGDPNDPNADPNAAPADPNAAAAPDPNAPPPADPAAAMDVSDLGAPPPAADAAADPAAAGADPAAGGDPNAAPPADPNAAPGGDPNAAAPAPDETQQNVAGEAPNAAGTENGEQNKFDIGASKPFNAEGDELHLTDQEQEQLFTKINLLTKIPDLVNYGKYFYNITPENVDLNDIHYINTLYELSVKLGLLTDDFEGNNLLEKYDSYKFSVISKNPENALVNADQQNQQQAAAQGQPVAETTKKVKTENAGEVTIVTAPGVVIAKDVDDYMKQKDEANAEAHGEITFKGTLDRVRGLGSLVTFAGVLFGYPVVKTLYLKGAPESNKITKEKALEQLKKQGYADVEILAIEPIDPIDYLYHEYAGMRTLEDEFTREYMKQRLEKRVARNLKKLNESVESKSIIPQEFDDDIGKIVDNLNKEIMEDPTIDFSKEVGLPKMMVAKEDFEKCFVESPVLEDGDDGNDCCQFCVTKNGANNLSKVLFSTNCQKLCKCLEGIASTYGMNLSAIAEGDDILKGVDKITLTFERFGK